MSGTVAIWLHDHRDGRDYFSRLLDLHGAVRFLSTALSLREQTFHYFGLEVEEHPWSEAPGQWELLERALNNRQEEVA